MEPSRFNDIRTIWFGQSEYPHAETDYETLLERTFGELADRSISKFSRLWNFDLEDEKVGETRDRLPPSHRFLSPPDRKERGIGHYCVIKPLLPFMEEFLTQMCQPYGFIVEAKVRKSKLDGALIGVVDFKEQASAERAAKSINGADLGDGIILSACYVCKEKRPKGLDIITDRQLRSTMERKKQPFLQQNGPGSNDDDIFSDLCQQWTFFTELHGSKAMSVDTLMLNLKANTAFPKTAIYGAEGLEPGLASEDVATVLKDLCCEGKTPCSRKLNF